MKDRFGVDWSGVVGAPYWSKPQLGRRLFFQHAASAVGGYLLLPSRPMETVAKAGVTVKATAKNVIFVMMQGAPSHTDTFDLKPTNGMPVAQFKPTEYNGVLFPQGLMPGLAGQLGSITLLRSVRAWAAVHGLMQTWVQMGRNPATPTAKISPHIGSVVSLELTRKEAILPAFIALNGTPRVSSGFLPVAHGPFVLAAGSPLPNTSHPEGGARFADRSILLQETEQVGVPAVDLGISPEEIADWKARSRSLMYNSAVDRIFNLAPDERLSYGNSPFGNACVTARNLLRANLGTRFIQITYGSWDHHANLYPQLTTMAGIFDAVNASRFDVNRIETGLGQLGDVVVVSERARDTANPQFHAALYFGGNVTTHYNVGYGEAASGFQNTERFTKYAVFVTREIDHAVGNDDIDRVVGQGNVFDFPFEELDVLHTRLALVLASQGEHFVGHVEAVGFAGRPDTLSGQ